MTNEITITKETVKTLLPERKEDSHKGSFGSVLNIAGSINYRGAAYLSTVSALKVGAGYVTLAAIEEVISSVSILCPEAVFVPLKQKDGTIKASEYKKIIEILPKHKVLSLGCGISSLFNKQNEIENFVKNLLCKYVYSCHCEVANATAAIQKNNKLFEPKIIIDADGINIISKLNIENLPKNTILTPHPMELSRLLEVEVNEIQKNRSKYAKSAAQKFGAIVVLKGHNTVITNGDEVYINQTGNSALAKAGSGDVLTGMISGFLAQGVEPLKGAILGVYLHGLTGEIASQTLTQYSVNASDTVNFIHEGIKSII